MDEESYEIGVLIKKHMDGELNIEEKQRLDSWITASSANRLQFEKITDPDQLQQSLQAYFQAEEYLLASRSPASVIDVNRSRKLKIYWIAAASIIFMVASTCAFLYFNRSPSQQPAFNGTPITKLYDIQPGSQKATLVLEDNSVIALDEAGKGTIAKQGQVIIRKNKDGQLYYDVSQANSDPLTAGAHTVIKYNTITTPRGGYYLLILPDGSKAWLNAASSLKFPVSFTGKERSVELKGEAYLKFKRCGQAL